MKCNGIEQLRRLTGMTIGQSSASHSSTKRDFSYITKGRFSDTLVIRVLHREAVFVFSSSFSLFLTDMYVQVAYTIHTMYKVEFFFPLREFAPSISYVSRTTEHRKSVASLYHPTFLSSAKGFCARSMKEDFASRVRGD